ncbi:GNAT family N-acetyltransferase [Promicromonospora xylanilytica]
MTVRPFAPVDLGQVVSFEEVVFGEDRWSRDSIEATVEHPDTRLFVAEVENESGPTFAGYCALYIEGSTVFVTTIGVGERFRRIGAGRAMMARLMDEARRMGASSMRLNLRIENFGAKKLYESIGFRSVGVEKGYYESDGADAETMVLEF